MTFYSYVGGVPFIIYRNYFYVLVIKKLLLLLAAASYIINYDKTFYTNVTFNL